MVYKDRTSMPFSHARHRIITLASLFQQRLPLKFTVSIRYKIYFLSTKKLKIYFPLHFLQKLILLILFLLYSFSFSLFLLLLSTLHYHRFVVLRTTLFYLFDELSFDVPLFASVFLTPNGCSFIRKIQLILERQKGNTCTE